MPKIITPEEAVKLQQKQDEEVKKLLAEMSHLLPKPTIDGAIAQCKQAKNVAKTDQD